MTQSSGPSSGPSPSTGEASKEQVNHPVHYTSHPSGVECIQITEHYNFNIGNVIKYVWRSGLKNDELEDLRKARWYLDREIARRTAGTPVSDNCLPSNQPEIECPVAIRKEEMAGVPFDWQAHIRPPDAADRALAAATDEAWGINNETPTTAPAADGTDWPTSGAAVAWAVVSDSREEIDCEFIYPDEATAGDVALDINGGVVPLYRYPQPTLADAERRAIRVARDAYADDDGNAECESIATVLSGLLERTRNTR